MQLLHVGQQIVDVAQALKVSENSLRDFIPVALRRHLREPRKISAFQCFCGDEKAADQAAQQEVLISTMTISLEPCQLFNKSQATIAI